MIGIVLSQAKKGAIDTVKKHPFATTILGIIGSSLLWATQVVGNFVVDTHDQGLTNKLEIEATNIKIEDHEKLDVEREKSIASMLANINSALPPMIGHGK